MTDISNPTNMRVEQWSDGCWGVREDELPPCDINNYGWLAGGFATATDAQEWLSDTLLERQCKVWEAHIRPDEDDEECPF